MARSAVSSRYSWLGMNYYHESMGYITRSNAEIDADLDKIKTLTSYLKIYANPLGDNVSICANVCTRAKAKGFHVVWSENDDDTELNDTTWASTYTPAVLADALVAKNAGADEFLIGNELSIHINSGADMMADTSNYVAYVNAMKTLATSVQDVFTTGNVGISEAWGQDYKWGSNSGKGASIDVMYFILYEAQAQFKTSLTNLLAYENLGTIGLSEFSGADTMGNVVGTNESAWADIIANRCKIIDDLGCSRAYAFTFREPDAKGWGYLDEGDDTNFRTAWQSLSGGRRWFYN